MLSMASNRIEIISMRIYAIWLGIKSNPSRVENSSIVISVFLFNDFLPGAPVMSSSNSNPVWVIKNSCFLTSCCVIIVSYVTLIARQDRFNLQIMYNYPSMFVACEYSYACVCSDSQINLTKVFPWE
jgi:hypothetical protein